MSQSNGPVPLQQQVNEITNEPTTTNNRQFAVSEKM